MVVPEYSMEMLGMPAVSYLAVADAEFPVIAEGTGPSILFVHGAWADLRIWSGLWEAIAKRSEFLAITQRHFGCQAWPQTKSFSRDVHTDDLIALIKAMNKPVHLVGWSYAGAIVLRTACKVPELVRSVLIYEPSFESEVLQPGQHELRYAREIFWNKLQPSYEFRDPAICIKGFGRVSRRSSGCSEANSPNWTPSFSGCFSTTPTQ